MPHEQEVSRTRAIENEALAWFVRLQSDQLRAAERTDFERWYAADPAHAAAYDRIAAFWDSPAFEQAAGRAAGPEPRQAPSRFRSWLAMAAALVMAVGLSLVIAGVVGQNADYRTGSGERQTVTLADGSTMTLNSSTAVRLDWSGQRRGTRLLEGEIYLDVIHDPDRPFVIEAGGARVEVLGTRFAVRHTDDGVTVSGRSGTVALDLPGQSRQLVTGGERLRWQDGHLQRETLNERHAFAWLEGRLVFRDRSLDKLLAELDRHYPGRILLIGSSDDDSERLTGSYDLSDPGRAARSLARIADRETVQVSPWLLLVY